jgi:hypothetical protein
VSLLPRAQPSAYSSYSYARILFSLPRLYEVEPESFEEAVKATECGSYLNSLLDVTTTELAVRDVPERLLAMSPETDPRSMLAWFAIAEA